MAAAADAYPLVLGQLDYLAAISNGTADGTLTPAKTSGVTEVVQIMMTQFHALIASPATIAGGQYRFSYSYAR